MMVKCVKLPVIQARIVFEGFLRGGLRRKNRVVSRRIYRIFTIEKNVISLVELPKNEIHNHAGLCV